MRLPRVRQARHLTGPSEAPQDAAGPGGGTRRAREGRGDVGRQAQMRPARAGRSGRPRRRADGADRGLRRSGRRATGWPRRRPIGLILVATGLAAWFAARVTGRAAWRLRTAEARLRAAAEALPDGLVVCDRDDRIAFYNSRYPEHHDRRRCARPWRSASASTDWMREGMARGPCYHPEMGEDFLERRLRCCAAEQRSEHVHRLADGRWVRIRESRHAGRRPGAADHGHHRGAPPRRRAAPARARGRAGRRPGGDHRRRPRLHLRQPRLRDHDRLHPGRGAGPRAAGRPVERPAAAGVLRRDAPRARGRPHAGTAPSSTGTATAT